MEIKAPKFHVNIRKNKKSAIVNAINFDLKFGFIYTRKCTPPFHISMLDLYTEIRRYLVQHLLPPIGHQLNQLTKT